MLVRRVVFIVTLLTVPGYGHFVGLRSCAAGTLEAVEYLIDVVSRIGLAGQIAFHDKLAVGKLRGGQAHGRGLCQAPQRRKFFPGRKFAGKYAVFDVIVKL